MGQSQPSFTYDQWVDVITKIETLEELGPFEEMLRKDLEILYIKWEGERSGSGLGKMTDLTALMRQKHKELLQAK